MNAPGIRLIPRVSAPVGRGLWLLNACAEEGSDAEAILTEDGPCKSSCIWHWQ